MTRGGESAGAGAGAGAGGGSVPNDVRVGTNGKVQQPFLSPRYAWSGE